MVGLDLDKYWETTPAQFEKHVKVYKMAQEQKAKEDDINNYNLGRYLMYAFNDPKKYPKKPFSDSVSKKRDLTGDDLENIMKRNTILLGGKIK